MTRANVRPATQGSRIVKTWHLGSCDLVMASPSDKVGASGREGGPPPPGEVDLAGCS